MSKSAAKASPLPWRVLLIVLVFALLAYTSVSRFLVVPSPLPKVLRSVQLSHFGRLEVGSPVRTDGTRLYFTERTGGAWEIAEASAEGGEPTPILTPFSNVYLTDIDPTETKLLVGLQGPEPDSPLWVLPAAGGSARRLGDVVAADAAWSPDGRQIVYSRGTAVYLVGADGSDVRKLVEAPGSALRLHWSPDGHRIGFTVADLKTTWRSLWEVGADGNNPHPLSLNWGTAPPTRAGWAEGECCGVWTPDGRYLVFRSIRQGVFSLWALREPPARGQALAPVQLYTSPDQIGPPSFSPDGNQVLFPDYHPTRELVRYDMSQKKFLPYLNGIPARFVSVSHDGRWVAYRNEADGALWRSRSDGTERLQLTFPPMDPYRSSWSPDGKRIVFDATVPGKQTSIYVVSSRGGIARKILEETDEEWAGSPSWSPDGRLLVFGRAGPTGGLYLFDWGSHAVRMVEGSGGLSAGQWSPNGRYLSAVGANSHGLMLFDLAARRWSELTSDSGLYSDGVRWSADSRYIFYQDLFLGREQPVFRVQVADRKVEKITSYGMIERADVTGFSLTGLAPDGSPLASLIHSNSDIYALQVEFPH